MMKNKPLIIGLLLGLGFFIMPRQLSATGIDLIKRHEGFRSKEYLDAGGKATIGYGHLIKSGESFPKEGISRVLAETILESDVANAEKAVNKLVKVPLNQNQFNALVSFVFNLGAERFKKSTLLRELNAKRYDTAALQFPRWVYAGGKVWTGLVRRREDEKQLFESARLA